MSSKKKKKTKEKKNNIRDKEILEKETDIKNDIKQENKEAEMKLPIEEALKEEDIENKEIIDVEQTKEEEKIDKKLEEIAVLEHKIEETKPIQEEKESSEELKHVEDKQYVKHMLANKKRKVYIAINLFLLIILGLAFSTIFAVLNLGNTTFAKNVSIKGIDISGLTIEEARNKLNEALNIELMMDLELQYNKDYTVDFDTNQIEYTYNIDKAIEKAYQVGRDGNIFQNNYTLLITAFWGKDIAIEHSYNKELLSDFVNGVEAKIPGLVVQATYYIEDNMLIINSGKDGITVQKEVLQEEILNNIEQRKAEEIIENHEKQIIEIPIKQTAADPINMDKIYSEVYTEPKDAYYESNPFKIYAEVNGIDLAQPLEEVKNEIASEKKEEYRIALKITPAQKTINDIGTEAFPYLISSFSTKYDASNLNRSKNLAIAAGKINGTVLMPGETFSFNKVVGKRTIEEGYKDAKIYADGGVVDGLAGGICQISSTLYNAVLLANLQITERRNHSFTTSYVPAGRDATVVYGTTDFQFTNSRNYPIKIEASVANGIASFKIHGIAEENEYEVKIIPVTTQSIPYSTQYIPDATLAPGQQVVTQAGHSGYKVTTYKELKQNGITVSREVLSNDTYQPMKAIVRIG